MLSQFPSPVIIAHRGDSAHAPENTLAAFRLALEKNADGIELDVHLSADGRVIVIHDTDLSRTTNGQGKVGDYSLTELRQLDASGEPIPLLEEVLGILGSRAILNIELKGKDKRLPACVVQLVEKHNKQNQIVYSSFNPFLLWRIKQIAPEAALGLLLLPGIISKVIQSIFEPHLKPWSLHPHFSSITPKFIEKARRKGRRVITYTVNKPEDIKRLIKLGIDGIFTDDPSAAVAIRTETQ
jgi:glycerophosphoryl diester phosphodiesterase